MEEKVVKQIYSVELGRLVDYVLDVDDNGEILALSTANEEFLKFPNVAEEEVDALIEAHNEQASTQVKKAKLFSSGKHAKSAALESEKQVS